MCLEVFSRVFGLWMYSLGVFGGILGCLRCATQDLLGDNRRTGVKMDLIEDTILTASPHLSNVKWERVIFQNPSRPHKTFNLGVKGNIAFWSVQYVRIFGPTMAHNHQLEYWKVKSKATPHFYLDGQKGWVGVRSTGEQQLEVLHRNTGC